MRDTIKADVRTAALRYFDQAAPMVIAAFNLAGSREWQFPPDVQERATSLLRELSHLFFENEARIRPAAIAVAKGDDTFQDFLQRALKKPGRSPSA